MEPEAFVAGDEYESENLAEYIETAVDTGAAGDMGETDATRLVNEIAEELPYRKGVSIPTTTDYSFEVDGSYTDISKRGVFSNEIQLGNRRDDTEIKNNVYAVDDVVEAYVIGSRESDGRGPPVATHTELLRRQDGDLVAETTEGGTVTPPVGKRDVDSDGLRALLMPDRSSHRIDIIPMMDDISVKVTRRYDSGIADE